MSIRRVGAGESILPDHIRDQTSLPEVEHDQPIPTVDKAKGPKLPSDIIKDPNYSRLTPAQRNIIEKALTTNPDNPDLKAQIKTMMGDSRFKSMKSYDRTYTLNGLAENPGARAVDLIQFVSTSSYKSFDRMQR